MSYEDYELLDKQPADWEINYSEYYILKNERYEALTNKTSWEENKYYK